MKNDDGNRDVGWFTFFLILIIASTITSSFTALTAQVKRVADVLEAKNCPHDRP